MDHSRSEGEFKVSRRKMFEAYTLRKILRKKVPDNKNLSCGLW